MRAERGITQKYATLREELLREQNWVTPKLSRLDIFYAGFILGIMAGIIVGVGGVYLVYHLALLFRGG